MTTLQAVHELMSGGHQIEFYVRKDGGILVKSIDGQRYTGAKGNAKVRQMTGIKLSEARFKQLKYATREHIASVKWRKQGKPPLDDAVQKRYSEVKKQWNKAFKAKGGKPHSAGYFGKSSLRYSYEHGGKEATLTRISEAERYSSGIAYSENVRILVAFIRDAGNKHQSQELLKLADDIEMNSYAIREEWMEHAYDELYKADQGVDPKQVAQSVRKVLRLL